jgi:large subunit ribosomal protein L9
VEVILLERVGKLGNLGDQVVVAHGYARNYLIPEGKAVKATKDNIASFESKRADYEKLLTDKLDVAKVRQERINALAVVISAKVVEDTKLYGSVGTREIVDAAAKAGVEINKSEILLPNGPIHETGDHEVQVHVHTDTNATIKISIVAEE